MVVLERKLIVVFVIAKALGADDAVRHHQVMALVSAHDCHARVSKELRRRRRHRGWGRWLRELESPPRGLPCANVAGQGKPRRFAEHRRRWCEQVTRVLRCRRSISAEHVQAPVVRISELRHQTVGTQHRREVADHLSDTPLVARRQRCADRTAEMRTRHEQLGDEAVIRHRRLEVRAVRQHLHVDLLFERIARERLPGESFGQAGKHRPEEPQSDHVAEEVVAGHLVGVFEVGANEPAVIEQRRIRTLVKCGVEPAGLHELEPEQPTDGAQPHVHRAGPVDADADRIRLDEVVELVRDLVREPFIAGEPKRLAECHPVLAPGQLPRQFDVGIARPHLVKLPLLVRNPFGKTQAADRIEVPVDRLVAAARRPC